MDINIMTWNVNWFRGPNENKKYYNEKDSKKDYFDTIVKEIKEFLKQENSIVFLQEFPYDKKYESQEKHKFYLNFKKKFEKKYDIFENTKTFKKILRFTIAVANKGYFEKEKNFNKRNLIIAVKRKGYIFMGVHMPVINNKGNEEVWNYLIKSIKNKKENIFIAGDFNTYIFTNKNTSQNKNTKNKYEELLNLGMKNCVSEENDTFKGGTSIDKILIPKNTENIKYNVEIKQRKFEFSDHKSIEAKLSIPD